MEVILSPQIAFLVWEYLKDEKLEKTLRVFGKTSPFLKNDYPFLKQGYRPPSQGHGSLTQIVREHCLINNKVCEFIENLQPCQLKETLSQDISLYNKISTVLDIAQKCSTSESLTNERKRDRSPNISQESNSSNGPANSLDGSSGYSKRRRLLNSAEIFSIDTSPSVSSLLSSDNETENKVNTELKRLTSDKSNQQDVSKSGANFATKKVDSKICRNKKLKQLTSKPSLSSRSVQFKNNVEHKDKSPESDVPLKKRLRGSQAGKPSQNTKNDKMPIPRNPKKFIRKTHQKSDLANLGSQISEQEQISQISEDATSPQVNSNNAYLCSAQGDPNFSISKLIQLSAGQQASITSTPMVPHAPTTVSHSVQSSNNQITISPFSAEQLLFDTGQMSIPFFMANENFNFITLTGDYQSDQPVFAYNTDNNVRATVDSIQPQAETISIPTELIEEYRKSTQSPDKVLTAVKSVADNPVQLSRESEIPQDQIMLSTSEGQWNQRTPTTSIDFSQLPKKSGSASRRRTSHVRALNFKTPAKASSEPESGKTECVAPVLIITSAEISDNDAEIITTELQAKETSVEIIANENSCSSGLDFAKNNQTIIPLPKSLHETPKRKTDSRRCVRPPQTKENKDELPATTIADCDTATRRNSKFGSGDQSAMQMKPVSKPQQELSGRKKKTEEINSKNEDQPADSMTEWLRIRSIPPSEWDKHIREESAKTDDSNVRRRFRTRNKTEKAQKSKKNISNASMESEKVKIVSTATGTDEKAVLEKPSVSTETAWKKTPAAKKQLINFKIPTPKKLGESAKNNKNIKSPTEISRKSSDTQSDANASRKLQKMSEVAEERITNIRVSETEMQRRSANIAALLDTPFKVDTSKIPVTPRFIIPSTIETPISKMFNSFPSNDRSFLTQSTEVHTPGFAITPGADFFCSLDKGTPKTGTFSNRATDYSSSSSYYRPDESADIDKNFDNIINEERISRKRAAATLASTILTSKSNQSTSKATEPIEISTETQPQTVSSGREITEAVEVPEEEQRKILEKTKAFEKGDSNLTVPTPFTFAEKFPETLIDTRSNSSVGSSSSSTSFSSSSSSSDSPLKNCATTISEEAEWVVKNAENSEPPAATASVEAVGELRYPVRWLSPRNKKHMACNKSELEAEAKKTEFSDLELKRQRMKEKLRRDFSARSERKRLCAPSVVLMKKSGSTNVKRQSKSLKSFKALKAFTADVSCPPKTTDEDIAQPNASSQIDMMKALNLSAKNVAAPALKRKEMSKNSPIIDTELIKRSAETSTVRKLRTAPSKAIKEKLKTTFVAPKRLSSGKSSIISKHKIYRKEFGVGTPLKTKLRPRNPIVNLKPQRRSAGGMASSFVKFPSAGRKAIHPKIATSTSREFCYINKSESMKSGVKFKTFTPSKSQDKAIFPPEHQVSEMLKTDSEKIKTLGLKSSSDVLECKVMLRSNIKLGENATSEPSETLASPNAPPCRKLNVSNSENESDADLDSHSSDEDPYDACEAATIDETDTFHYRSMVYDETKNVRNQNEISGEPISSDFQPMVMKIMLNGIPHKVTTSDELELFRHDPINKEPASVKSVAKKRHKNQQKGLVPRSPRENEELSAVRAAQVKINLKHQNINDQRSSYKKESAKGEKLFDSRNRRSSNSKDKTNVKNVTMASLAEPSTLRSDTSAISVNTVASTIQAKLELNQDDIFAVLSHLHGDGGVSQDIARQ